MLIIGISVMFYISVKLNVELLDAAESAGADEYFMMERVCLIYYKLYMLRPPVSQNSFSSEQFTNFF